MKKLLLSGGLAVLSLAGPVAAQPTCLCNVMNLTRCEGTGPTLLNTYLWSLPERESRWFNLTATYATRSPEECRALEMAAVPRHVPVFNYYGSLVHSCALVWRHCD